jgi:uncharacterized protein YecE (DUF72 family)
MESITKFYLNEQPAELGKAPYMIGTAGWHYKDWEYVFYPAGEKTDKLEYYSAFFDCVEIDSSFYNFYTPERVKDWLRRTRNNRNFMFSAKIHNIFTHQHNYSKKDIKIMKDFLDELKSNGKLESALFQFPYHFLNTRDNRNYVFNLSKLFKEYRMVIELRHRSWHTPLTYNFLEENKYHLCNIDMPDICENVNFTTSVLGRYAYIRLHGKNESAWLKQSDEGKFNYLYSGSELEEILSKIETLRQKADRVYIILNNHPIGKAAVNAFSLISLLKNSKVYIPEQTVYCYPFLKNISEKIPKSQVEIFA